MTLRFYAGGPRAIRGARYWETPDCYTGCDIAYMVGADIPWDTYDRADPKVSQFLGALELISNHPNGRNHTAILPLEDEE